jgi:hypothetical protein
MRNEFDAHYRPLLDAGRRARRRYSHGVQRIVAGAFIVADIGSLARIRRAVCVLFWRIRVLHNHRDKTAIQRDRGARAGSLTAQPERGKLLS